MISARRKSGAMRVVASSCSWAKAHLDVRSIATTKVDDILAFADIGCRSP
jgi:hypothetical protein